MDESNQDDTAEAADGTEPVGEIGAAPVCRNCGSDDVVKDAWASWNPVTGDWELSETFDEGYCRACEATTKWFRWQKCTESRRETIRCLNDALRTGESDDGLIVITAGVRDMGRDFVALAARAVATFDAFTPDNDPHGEHDFGALEVAGRKLFFKLDYFDLAMTAHSPDAADPAVTRRVLTIMLASEY